MSHRLLDKARRRLEAESGCRANPWGGRLAVALVYPNTYRHAMSNLGFLTVYHLLNSRADTLCERFFLPDADDLAEHRATGYPLFSLESARFLDEFDLVAFSLSFENDYLNLPVIFDLARLPWRAAARAAHHPLVLAGGVCAFLNPEPLAEVMDLFAVGEAEPILPDLIAALQGQASGRRELLESLAKVPGLYVPSLYEPTYHPDGTPAAYQGARGAPAQVRRRWQENLDASASLSYVLTEETEFGDMFLSEVSRGCSRGCRFCAAGFLYLPPRERSLENLVAQVDEGLCHRRRIGLVGAAVADHPEAAALQRHVVAQGGGVSVSSLRIDALGAQEVAALADAGHRSVAIAPEAGSQRLRDLVNKGLSEADILRAVELLAEAGIPNLKLYFLIGLPGENAQDTDELLRLVGAIRTLWLEAGRKRGRLGHLTLSLNPFVPKPFTPLQWAPMAREKDLQNTLRRIRGGVARLANTEMICESLRAATIQAFFARGDRRTGQVLPLLAAGRNLKAACRELDLDPDFYVTRPRGKDEVFPWEVIDNGVRRDYLWQEYQNALQGRSTPRCAPGCRRCGVCG
ncbi:radical SAM protein [Geoalkalibacter halelectricus]|uniref:Radical SAM protein n=1 Tax=Geoalkalibacter halelectricus TaxID=2847045 RepID=A0ABY5ZMZ0_9BACT|nr:radical SAM protein [Geoalkalibacter halelectricus]MDO3378836.1 radical SAM protein [Geoalkalibacter halelectricus]UWZ79859.1 radical SAM protein [Geoalkalibacter halelectricus]